VSIEWSESTIIVVRFHSPSCFWFWAPDLGIGAVDRGVVAGADAAAMTRDVDLREVDEGQVRPLARPVGPNALARRLDDLVHDDAVVGAGAGGTDEHVLAVGGVVAAARLLAGREQVVGEEPARSRLTREDPAELRLAEDPGGGDLVRAGPLATASKKVSASRRSGLSPLVSLGGFDSSSEPVGHESSSRVLP